jgi:hypothetical protein
MAFCPKIIIVIWRLGYSKIKKVEQQTNSSKNLKKYDLKPRFKIKIKNFVESKIIFLPFKS